MDVEDAKVEGQRLRSPSFWPTPQDYNEAMQTPAISFSDSELKTGLCAVDQLGLPRAVSGAFASVYQMDCTEKSYAVRCFLRNVRDQKERYQLLSKFIMNDTLDSTVQFHYQENGILIRGQWFPILKMEWVQGQTLDRYIAASLHDTSKLHRLKREFFRLVSELQSAGAAHGDLQHGNILVTANDELRLVDYDGMFVPSMEGMKSNELGHRNYQHPQRKAEHFDKSLDSFASWSILTSLCALAEKPSLFHELKSGDDCLLFRRTDYEDVWASNSFRALDALGSNEIDRLTNSLKWLASSAPGTTLQIHDSAPECPPPLSPVKMIETTRVFSANDSRVNFECSDEQLVEKWWNDYLQCSDSSRGTPHAEPEFHQTTRKVKLRRFDGVDPAQIGIIIGGATLFAALLGGRDLALPILVIGTLITLLLLWIFLEEKRLVQTGIVSPGVIAKKVKEEKYVDGMKTVSYHVSYDYPVRLGDGTIQVLNSTHEVREDSFDDYVEGAVVTILYGKNNPTRCVIYRECSYEIVAQQP